MRNYSNQTVSYSADGAETWWTDGLSHDMANVLTVIQSTCELLKDAAKEGEKHLINGMIQACHRGSSMLTPTKRWWQHGEFSRDTTNISNALQEVAQMSAALAPDVEVVVFQTEQWTINVPPPVIFRCVLNIATNAIDACRAAGTNTDERPRIELHANASESVVRLTIKDNGPGISTEILPRIFEPLFSTRISSRSAKRGLGLFVVQNLLTEFGGKVSVGTTEGSGSTFCLEFPRSTQEDSAAAE